MFRTSTSMMLVLASLGAQAALLGRMPATPGGTDYQAYYDTALNITWVADANLSRTSDYDSNGQMTWPDAQTWIASLNTASYLGLSDWRLPSMDVNADTVIVNCSQAGITELICRDNEMGYMFWRNQIRAFSPLPFANVRPDYYYWSGTESAADPSAVWVFNFGDGAAPAGGKGSTPGFYAWAVRPGDINPDTDGDGIANDLDNCRVVANLDQFDGDNDGYGNRCDGDLNENSATNAQDYAIFRTRLGTADASADLNHNGIVNAQDYAIFRSLLGSAPGPSGLTCAGAVPCP